MSFNINSSIKFMSNSNFIRQWRVFFSIVLNPFVLILILVTIGFIYFAARSNLYLKETEDVIYVEELFILIASIFSGLAGAVISSRWNKLSETNVLVTRGKSAIRGLNLLLLNLIKLEERIIIHISRLGEKARKSISISYEEFAHTCRQLQEEAVNAIEEWQDIIPEANVKNQIGVLSDLRAQLMESNRELGEIKNKYENLEQDQEQEKEQLQREIEEKEDEIAGLRRNLRTKKSELGESVIGGLSSRGSYYYPSGTMFSDLGSILNPDPSQLIIKYPTGNVLPTLYCCPQCSYIFPSQDWNRCPMCGYVKKSKESE